MFGSDTLEVVIGLVFVYFLISLLCTTLTEWIARIFALRSGNLKQGLIQLLHQESSQSLKDNKALDFFNHPLINELKPKDNWRARTIRRIKHDSDGFSLPSHLSAQTFSQVLLDMLGQDNTVTGNTRNNLIGELNIQSEEIIHRFETNIDSLPDDLKKVLGSLLDSAKTESEKWQDAVTKFRGSIEKWFENSMDRVSGWYKRKTQVIVLVLALIICFLMNVDTFTITRELYHDTALRSMVVEAAEIRVQQDTSDNITTQEVKVLLDDVSALNLPIGWNDENRAPDNFGGWVTKICGTIFTAFAVSLGSAFWFDLLNKLVNMRASGKKPDSSEKKTDVVA
jgi:hypothetical protein